MAERRPSGVLGGFFSKEQDESEYVELASPPAAARAEDGQQKRRSFRLSFMKPPNEDIHDGPLAEGPTAQYQSFSGQSSNQNSSRRSGKYGSGGADANRKNDQQLVVHTASATNSRDTSFQETQEQGELSISQSIKLKASRWLDRLRSSPSSSLPTGVSYSSAHHVKASRYIDQGSLQPLHVAAASIASEQKALILAPQASSEGLWRERGRLAGLKAQRDGWIQKRDGLLEQLRLAEEKHALLKQQLQHRATQERQLLRQQSEKQKAQAQQCDGHSGDVGDMRDVDESQGGTTSLLLPEEHADDVLKGGYDSVKSSSSTCQASGPQKSVVDEPQVSGTTSGGVAHSADSADEAGVVDRNSSDSLDACDSYMAFPGGSQPSERSSQIQSEFDEVGDEAEDNVHDEILGKGRSDLGDELDREHSIDANADDGEGCEQPPDEGEGEKEQNEASRQNSESDDEQCR